MKAIKSLICLVLCFSSSVLSAQIAERSSLGLEGASLLQLVSNMDTSLVFAGVDGPNGIYFSRDLGDNWISGEGGDYEAGSISSIAVIGDYVYIVGVRGGLIYKAALPSGDVSEWTPVWSKVGEIGENPAATAAGNYLLIGNRGRAAAVFATSSDSFIDQTNQLPENHNILLLRPFEANVYGLSEVAVEGGERESYFFKAPFDASTGQVGEYTILNRATVGLPAAPATLWNIAIAPDGTIYTAVAENNIYRSTDSAASFTETTIDAQFNSFCFSGNSFILGTTLSTDGGNTTSDLSQTLVSESGRVEDKACLISPADADIALIGSNRGAYKTANLSDATPTFLESYQGFEGVIVQVISQATGNPNRAVLGTASGLAFTDDFSTTAPTWQFPICPGSDCVGADKVVIDPNNDDHIYYGSGNIRRGVVDDSSANAQITWSDFANKPKADASVCVLQMYSFLPNVLVVGQCKEQSQQDGGLYFFDSGDATYQEVQDADVKDKPVSAFIALDANLFFAAIGGFSDFPDQVDRYLVKSSDGGVTWEKIEDSSLSATLLARHMAYDEKNDILYVGTAQNPSTNGSDAEAGVVYKLADAKAGGSTWAQAADFPEDESGMDGPAGVTALAVDPEMGDIYASSWEKIFVSIDGGTSWLLYYQGLLDEESYDLSFDSEIEASNRTLSVKTSRSGLTQAAQTGVYAFDAEIPRVSCSIRLAPACRKRVSPGTACAVRVSLVNPSTTEKYSGVKVRLQRNTKDQESNWKNAGRARVTNKRGRRVFSVKAPPRWGKSKFIRVVSEEPACTSDNVQIRTSKKRR